MQGGVGSRAEDLLHEESVSSEAEVDAPSVTLEVYAPVAATVESLVLVSYSLVESAQPSPLLAITQGSIDRDILSSLYIIIHQI